MSRVFEPLLGRYIENVPALYEEVLLQRIDGETKQKVQQDISDPLPPHGFYPRNNRKISYKNTGSRLFKREMLLKTQVLYQYLLLPAIGTNTQFNMSINTHAVWILLRFEVDFFEEF
jgi:hypothetical protein